ncbi:hypothetical protein [Hymenobacter convexus]|uniref:hypothetical protein n=1 Tax=Hymenobacter sp. CA1UV-4 TaxID=3063782 RepID=UPI002713703E|nr:hypothetical protein [Hymenobacter sp. CA1UV-4]MDO7854764.1 hypothetical protein [Hymenobacter sp. CA1UV-4]
MRLHYLFSVGLLAGVGLAGCTTKTDVEPEVPCGTYATVRLCHGMTTMCLTEHTTLELADGTRLRPSGPAWEAYLPHQADGQTLSIGYTPGPALPAGDVGNLEAKLTCLEEVMRCGTPAPGGN